jgi:hypothetical protein
MKSRLRAITLAALLVTVVGLLPFWHAQGAQFNSRFIKLDNNTASATTNYLVGFDIATSGAVGSLRVQFCADSPIIGTPCTPPVGFDVSGVALGSQTGLTGFSVDPSTTQNVLVLTRTPFVAIPARVRIELNNVVNQSSNGPCYARIETFTSTDATGADTDYGGVAFEINPGVSITTTVPPYLLFCTGISITGTDCNTATGDYIDFGELSSASTRTGTSQFVLATNAMFGLNVSLEGSTMTSGNNTIQALLANDVSRPGTSQFGLNLRKNTDPSVGQNPAGPGAAVATSSYDTPNRYKFVPGEQIVTASNPSDYRKFTVSYIVNVVHSQTPGIYVSSITYDCLASF